MTTRNEVRVLKTTGLLRFILRWRVVLYRIGEEPQTMWSFATQRGACDWGRRLAKVEKAEFLVQAKDGTIRQSDSFGNDPADVPG